MTRHINDPSAVVLYYYCDFRQNLLQGIGDVLAVWQHQLLRKGAEIPATLLEAYEDRGRDTTLVRSSPVLTPAVKDGIQSLNSVYEL